VKRIFADETYLRHWAGDVELGSLAETNQPVTSVSWFAAKAFAEWRGKRLPTVTEWEYAAALGFSVLDGSKEPEFQQAIRRWYSAPTPTALSQVAQSRANILGIHDLHGLIWEWTSDFNSALVTGDARGDSGIERQLFCGTGSTGNRNPSDYPAFLRYGFRSSLKASYCIHNLGFRCAANP
jgi:formylglycine-generating enzyme required for sulfatase activity